MAEAPEKIEGKPKATKKQIGCCCGVFLLIFVSVIAGVCVMVGGDEATLIRTFNGTGDQITPRFTIEDNTSAIDFDIKWDADDTSFAWWVHFSSVNTSALEGSPWNVISGEVPVVFAHPNPFANSAEFVIEVIASDGCSWHIEVWD